MPGVALSQYAAPALHAEMRQRGGAPRWPLVCNTDCSRAHGIIGLWPFPVAIPSAAADVPYVENLAPGYEHHPLTTESASHTHATSTHYELGMAWEVGNDTDNSLRPVDDAPYLQADGETRTYACWVRIDGVQTREALLFGDSAFTSNGAWGSYVEVNGSNYEINVYTKIWSAPKKADFASSSSTDWHRLLWTIKRDDNGTPEVRIWHNGVELSTTGTLSNAVWTNEQFEVNTNTFNRILDGAMAHVMVWNRELTEAEIWADYDPATRWDIYQEREAQVYSFPPIAATAGSNLNLAPALWTLVWSARVPVVSLSRNLEPSAWTMSWSALNPALNLSLGLDPAVWSLPWTAIDPNVSMGVTLNLTPNAWSMSWSALEPALYLSLELEPNTWSATWTSPQPTVLQGNDASVFVRPTRVVSATRNQRRPT